jgi:hypothetical protein
MHDTDCLALLAGLAEEHCGLNHGPGVDTSAIPASDYIALPMGNAETIKREMVIPVCAECAQALLGEEWTLIYCLECNQSQWICRARAKLHYRHHILWQKGCPKCTGKFGGLYFNDMPVAE